MTNEYTKAAQAVYDETKAALQLVYDSLNQGQQKKLLKEEAVKNLLVHYGIVNGDDT